MIVEYWFCPHCGEYDYLEESLADETEELRAAVERTLRSEDRKTNGSVSKKLNERVKAGVEALRIWLTEPYKTDAALAKDLKSALSAVAKGGSRGLVQGTLGVEVVRPALTEKTGKWHACPVREQKRGSSSDIDLGKEALPSVYRDAERSERRLEAYFDALDPSQQILEFAKPELQKRLAVLKLHVRFDEKPILPHDPQDALMCLNGLVLAAERGACATQEPEVRRFVSAHHGAMIRSLHGLAFDAVRSPDVFGRMLGRVGTFAGRTLRLKGVAVGVSAVERDRHFKTRPRGVPERDSDAQPSDCFPDVTSHPAK